MRRAWLALASVASGVLGACERAPVSGEASAAQVPARYAFLYRGFVATDEEAAIAGELPYERIELEEEGSWYVAVPTITLWRNGRADLGEEPARHGEVSLFDYGRLCQLIEEIGFEALPGRYDWGGFDGSTYTVRVWPEGAAEPVEVSDYGDVGPVELWGLRAAIGGVARRVKWK